MFYRLSRLRREALPSRQQGHLSAVWQVSEHNRQLGASPAASSNPVRVMADIGDNWLLALPPVSSLAAGKKSSSCSYHPLRCTVLMDELL